MQLKPILLIFIVVSCTMCGHALAGTIERRKRMLADLLTALRKLQIALTSMLEPLEEALKRTHFPLFEAVAERLPWERCAADAWDTVQNKECKRGGKADCLAPCDLSALDGLFEHLGMNGREEQAEAIQSCILVLEESLAETKERAAQTGKLYTSLGFLAGLSLAVLMI